MADISLLTKYFPQLTAQQLLQFAALGSLYGFWNSKVNLISRKDIDNLYLHHVLHSLAIGKIISFRKNAAVMDLGTGGGFPGIPLAILFPETGFTLVDSISKKINAVSEIAAELGLKNVVAVCGRAEKADAKFDFVVTRATSDMAELLNWTKGKYRDTNTHELPNGLIALKGGNIAEELKSLRHPAKVFELKDFFKEKYFEQKKAVYAAAR